MAGLTAEGLVIRSLPEVRELINERLRGVFGPQLDLGDASALGQIVGIVSERISEVWEVTEAVNSSLDPDAAEGAQLAGLAAITGTLPELPASSTVTLTLTGSVGTVVASGSRARVVVTGIEFATTASATLLAVTAWAGSATLAAGARRAADGKIYQVTTAGTTAGSGGPTGTGTAIADGSVVWRFLGEGAAAADVGAASVDAGAIEAPAGSITEIETSVGGWDGVVNLLDADLGRGVETDEQLRARRVVGLATPGTSPVDAIRAELRAIDTVTSVTVFENDTDTTDGAGVPPHSIEALVEYPLAPVAETDQAIFDTLLAARAAGIRTHGVEVGTALDSKGNPHTMRFTRPDLLEVYVDVTLIKDPATYPADGDAQVVAAIVAWGDAQPIGRDVVASAIASRAFTVPGVLDVTAVLIGESDPPVASATLAVSLRERGSFDSTRVEVHSSDGAP